MTYSISDTKAGKMFAEFEKYCIENPDQRFMQALKNFLKVEAVLLWKPKRTGTCMMDYQNPFADMGIEDSFYLDR